VNLNKYILGEAMVSIFLASILCFGVPLASEKGQSKEISKVEANSYLTGDSVVERTRTQYNEGKYSEFLNKMDKDYRQAKKNNGLEGLIELRKETAKVNIHPEFMRSYDIIQSSKSENLLSAVKGASSALSKKVESATRAVPKESDLLRVLHFKVPGDHELTKDESTVVDIDIEYYYKSIHLDSTANSKDSLTDRKEKHMALSMEKMDRLKEASKSFEDKALQKSIESLALNLDSRLAKSYDMRDLIALSRGIIKPVTTLEKKVASIVASSQGEIADLHRQLLNNLDSQEPIAESVQK
jgi:hypothetical protein